RPVLLMVSFFAIGICYHAVQRFVPYETDFNKGDSIVFKIAKKLNSSEKYKKYEAVVKLENTYKKSIIYIPRNYAELNFENYYKAKAYAYSIKEPQYDFQFNYAKYLHR